jgi:hypothetical protein
VSAEAIPKLNPKLEALNPKQIPISKFKAQNRFGHLILFSISDLGFRIWFSRDCPNGLPKWVAAMTNGLPKRVAIDL